MAWRRSPHIHAIVLALVVASCGDGTDGPPSSPAGSFHGPSNDFTLGGDGTIRIAHTATVDDPQDYVVTGTYTSSLRFSNADNDTSYGPIDVVVSDVTLAGMSGSAIEVTSFYDGPDVAPGDTLLGWWKWTGLVDYGGQMQLRFNVAARGLRYEDPFSGADWLISGDP